jgi:hypothetical protein
MDVYRIELDIALDAPFYPLEVKQYAILDTIARLANSRLMIGIHPSHQSYVCTFYPDSVQTECQLWFQSLNGPARLVRSKQKQISQLLWLDCNRILLTARTLGRQ